MDQQLIYTILASSGGSALVVGGLSTWVGKVWANRILESEKARYSQQIEILKSELTKKQANEKRVSDAQFDLYSQLWSKLQDLRSAGADLWDVADSRTYANYINALYGAHDATLKGRIILPDEIYTELRSLIDVFRNYQLGKQKLIDIRSPGELDRNLELDDYRLHDQILDNERYKNQYEDLLDKLATTIKTGIGIDT